MRVFVALFLLLFSFNSFAHTKLVKIASGSITGVYYPVGGSLCRMLNKKIKEDKIRCMVESTEGSLENINLLDLDDVEFAIVQEDFENKYINKVFPFENALNSQKLRSVINLFDESFTILTKSDSAIKNSKDIFGKKINIGPVGTPSAISFNSFLEASGKSKEDFTAITNYKAKDFSKILCDGTVDVIFTSLAHPNLSIEEMVKECKVSIVSIDKETLHKILANNNDYKNTIIKGGLYQNNPIDIESFGVAATLVTSEKTEDEVVFKLLKNLFEDLDEFRSLHPTLSDLNFTIMEKTNNKIPVHYGAQKYFAEKIR